MMDDFDTMFPAFTTATAKLYEIVTVFTFILAFAGLLWAGWQTSIGSAGMNELFKRIVYTGLVTIVLGFLPVWVANTETGLRKALVEDLGMDPSATHKKYGELLNAQGIGNSDNLSWWEKLTDPKTSIAIAFCSGLMWLVSKIAWFIMWLAFIVQKLCLWMGLGIAPIFLGMFLWDVTAGTARNYFVQYFGILFWSLGWGVADLITQGLMGAAASSSGIIMDGGTDGFLGGYAAITFCLVLAIWILFSTIAMPVLIAKALTTGSQIGTAALAGFAGATAAAGGAAIMASGGGAARSGAGTGGQSGSGAGGNSSASSGGGPSGSGGAAPGGGGPGGGGLIGSGGGPSGSLSSGGGTAGEAGLAAGTAGGGSGGSRDVRSVSGTGGGAAGGGSGSSGDGGDSGGGDSSGSGRSRLAGAAGSVAGGMAVAAAITGAFAGQAAGVPEVSGASAALAGRASSSGGGGQRSGSGGGSGGSSGGRAGSSTARGGPGRSGNPSDRAAEILNNQN